MNERDLRARRIDPSPRPSPYEVIVQKLDALEDEHAQLRRRLTRQWRELIERAVKAKAEGRPDYGHGCMWAAMLIEETLGERAAATLTPVRLRIYRETFG